jgi:hypothetical protein
MRRRLARAVAISSGASQRYFGTVRNIGTPPRLFCLAQSQKSGQESWTAGEESLIRDLVARELPVWVALSVTESFNVLN